MGLKAFIRKRGQKYTPALHDARDRLLGYPIDTLDVTRPRRIETFPTGSPVPRIIVQTFRTPSVVRPIHSAVLKWTEMNPEFDYRFFDDAAARDFIASRFGGDVLKAYDSLTPAAFRADLWRYCYLVAEGGVYVDIRMVPVLALRTILGFADEAPPAFVAPRDQQGSGGGEGHSYLYNAFIAAAPNHPFLVAALDRAVGMILDRNYGRDMLEITGPGCFGAAVNDALGRPLDTRFEPGDHSHDSVGRYRILSHEVDIYYQAVVRLARRPAIVSKCIRGPMANADKAHSGPGYGELYHQRAVFR